MDEFMQLQWRIKEPHELEDSLDFITDDEISLSYIFSEEFEKELPPLNNENITNNREQQKVPGHQYNFISTILSFLTKDEQSKCLVALKLLQSGKKPAGLYEQCCVDLYNNCYQRISTENAKFLRFTKEQFLRIDKKNFKFKPFLMKYSRLLWAYKLNRCKEYNQFYKGIDVLPYSYKDDEEPVEMLCIQNLLELGSLARFSAPSLLKPYHIKTGFLPKTKAIRNSNLSVSKDNNIDKLVETTRIDVVISSSGLTKLLDFSKTNSTWDIPIVVKQYQTRREDGSMKLKNVVFVDKPFPNKVPSAVECNEKCTKVLLKMNFCDTEAFSFQGIETPHSYVELSKRSLCETQKSVSEAKENDKTGDGFEEIGTCSKRKLQTDETQENDKKIKLDNAQHENEHKMHHNVSYRLWKLHLKNEQSEMLKTKYQINSIHVLTRCKLNGCEATLDEQLQPVNIIPKIEYNLKYGAGIPTKEELIKEWVYAYFRPCSQVRRVRMHYNTGEVICIENCNAQKITHEAQTHYQHNMNLGFGVLYKLFSRLLLLTPGNYLLHHLPKDGAFIKLLQGTDKNEDGLYNLHDEYRSETFKIIPNTLKAWRPIDVNFILPRHNLAQEMPGMFKPRLARLKYIKTGKNNKKKKKKKKKKVIPQNTSLDKSTE